MTRASAGLALLLLLLGCGPDDSGTDAGMDPDAGPVVLDGGCPVSPSYRPRPPRDCLPENPRYSADGGGYLLADGGLPFLFGTWVPAPDAGGGDFSRISYDPARDVVVALGQGSTWTFDGARWTEHAATTPAGLSLLTFDPRRQELVALASAPPEQPQTWAWDGATWRNLQIPVDPSSSTRMSADGNMTYDAARQRIVLFNDVWQTWELDGSWALRAERGPSRSGIAVRNQPGLVFDCRHGELLLLGGYGVQGDRLWDWYAWRDSLWQPRMPLLPFSLRRPTVFDTEYGDVVAFTDELVSTYGGDWCVGRVDPRQVYMRHVAYDIHHRRYVGVDHEGGTWTLRR